MANGVSKFTVKHVQKDLVSLGDEPTKETPPLDLSLIQFIDVAS